MPSVPGLWSEAMLCNEYGYFGPDGEHGVAWALEEIKGSLTTLEQYLEEHPIQLPH